MMEALLAVLTIVALLALIVLVGVGASLTRLADALEAQNRWYGITGGYPTDLGPLAPGHVTDEEEEMR